MLATRSMRVSRTSCAPAPRQLKLSVNFYSTAARPSLWANLQEAPLDGNHATNHAYEQDKSSLKVNLGRGVYKDDQGKDVVLNCVRKAEDRILKSQANHSYLPFSGLASFNKLSAEFAFGITCPELQEGKVATVQTISGTGALRVGAEFLAKNLDAKNTGKLPDLYVPDPTYVNHFAVFEGVGFNLKKYRYYDPATNGLDLDGLLEDLKNAAPGSVILLHACAHNPTGVDPTFEQWKKISDVVKERGHLSFFDSAYQGFATGDPDKDAASYRHFVKEGNPVLVAQSYAKNFGLYGQRIGALNVVTQSPRETKLVLSRLNSVIRPMYSNPSLHGARIVSTIFGDPELTALWRTEVKQMADRISWCRNSLVNHLGRLGNPRNWQHISKQIGMFAYSGLSAEEVTKLRDYHVYLNLDGRMSMSGINSTNVVYLAESIHKATTNQH